MATTKHLPDKFTLPMDFSNFSLPSWKWLDEMFRDIDGRQVIRIEEFTEGDMLVIRAELPGIDPERDVDLDVVEGTLMLTARKTEKEEVEGRHFHRSEFTYGSFMRSIPLPKGVHEADITARYVDGILEVKVPMPTGDVADATFHVPITTR